MRSSHRIASFGHSQTVAVDQQPDQPVPQTVPVRFKRISNMATSDSVDARASDRHHSACGPPLFAKHCDPRSCAWRLSFGFLPLCAASVARRYPSCTARGSHNCVAALSRFPPVPSLIGLQMTEEREQLRGAEGVTTDKSTSAAVRQTAAVSRLVDLPHMDMRKRLAHFTLQSAGRNLSLRSEQGRMCSATWRTGHAKSQTSRQAKSK